MLFNSLQFIVFFVLVVIGYFLLPHRFRQLLLLAASYYFYACWKVGYLTLILSSTLVTYLTALKIASAPNHRTKRLYLIVSVVINLGLIFVFKYFNFFNDTFRSVFDILGLRYGIPSLDILLPVGISFYTFQALSYTIDVYRGDKTPERSPWIFALYIAFFPQLVAGPIERSTRLLPQLHQKFTLNYDRITDGLTLMLWGFFKKLVIADRLALYVNEVYNHPGHYSSGPVIAATYFFAFQIYCDFSGYSDIAIGASRVFGYDLMNNFNRPYAAKSVGEFWRNWHISLSTWFKDYLYIPLGGNRCAPPRRAVNLFIVFVVSGLWHGPSWTFIIWGALHGGFLILSIFTKPLREKIAGAVGLRKFPALHGGLQNFIVFNLVTFAWIFFRADSLGNAGTIIARILNFDFKLGDLPLKTFSSYEFSIAVLSILLMEVLQFAQRHRSTGGFYSDRPLYVRWPIYYLLVIGILIFGNFNLVEFIYFQF